MDDLRAAPGIQITEPINYIRFMGLVREAALVITDSEASKGDHLFGYPMHHVTPKYRAADYLDGGHKPISENFGTTEVRRRCINGKLAQGSLLICGMAVPQSGLSKI